MLILGIETSCDETSAAVVCDGKILSNVVSSQADLHAPYGGVVPEVASRQHLRLIDEVMRRAYLDAKTKLEELDAIAVTRGPGLPSALLVGVAAARGLAARLRKPLVPIHHLEAHLYSSFVPPSETTADKSAAPKAEGRRPKAEVKEQAGNKEQKGLGLAACGLQPFVALIVSGGHTLLVHVPQRGRHEILGRTLDDAAGECFDKVAQLLGLSYPGGPEIEREAKKGNPKAFDFPRPMLNSGDWNFSFSGLKTAVRYAVRGQGTGDRGQKNRVERGAWSMERSLLGDLCASFQVAVIEVLVEKTIRAAKACRAGQIALSGGVACNMALREAFEKRCKTENLGFTFAERHLCGDNAAMIALLAEQKMEWGIQPSQDWDIEPDWVFPSSA